MREILRLNQFARDVKKLNKSGAYDLDKLKALIEKLVRGEKLEPRYREHRLKNNWQDHFECHLEPDWLLIYRIDEKENLLVLVRTGSHSELFR